jgi:hypothetical protein
MVDPGAAVLELLSRNREVGGQVAGRALDGMAEPDRADRRGARNGPADHRHRVHVLQQHGVRAEVLHVAADVNEHRDRAEPAHDPADPERVADRLPQAEALRHLEVGDGCRPVAADLHEGDDVVRPVQRRSPVERGFDPGVGSQRGRDALGDEETFLVDVHQGDRHPVGQLREADDVAEQGAGEDGRAGADERDLH